MIEGKPPNIAANIQKQLCFSIRLLLFFSFFVWEKLIPHEVRSTSLSSTIKRSYAMLRQSRWPDCSLPLKNGSSPIVELLPFAY